MRKTGKEFCMLDNVPCPKPDESCDWFQHRDPRPEWLQAKDLEEYEFVLERG